MASTPNNTHPHYRDGYHLQHITQIAAVDHYDPSHGLFGELIDPSIVLQGLHLSDHVGRLDDPTAARATQAMHSFLCDDLQEIMIEFDNATPVPLILRWMDEKGICYPHFQWTLEAFSSKVQYSRLGHLFVLSRVSPDDGEEQLLGAYRIRMPLPSGSPHYLRVEPDPTHEDELRFHVEALLADPSGHDELIVASAALDPVASPQQSAVLTKTIPTLSTIVHNLRQHPDDPKFRSLRLSNPRVQKTIGSSWGARHLLHCIGFRETSDSHSLVLESPAEPERWNRAFQLLDQLKRRCQPGFVAELAAPPPWQGPVLTSTTTRTFGSGSGTNFLSDEEKWQRAERNRQRRGRAGRRPQPGQAPSSNGRWGR